MRKMAGIAALALSASVGAAASRTPDYGQAKDWAYNHVLKPELREAAGEPSEDTGVDLFYVYPTVAMTNAATTADGFVDIDDPQMRGDGKRRTGGAWSAYAQQGRVFGDLTHVYVPFYRQVSLAAAEKGFGTDLSKACDAYVDTLVRGPAYRDVAAALDVYFAKWNRGRKFILAGHSQGAAVLRAVMDRYFTKPENKEKLRNLVVSYQLGYGVGKSWLAKLEADTRGAVFTGVRFASQANDTGVIVSWNVAGPEASAESALRPADAVSINPLLWTCTEAKATASLNLGSLTNAATGAVAVGLCDAQVDAKTGTVVCRNLPAREYCDFFKPFGKRSLHAWDYRAYWENLHLNAYQRIVAATGRRPRAGRPADYAERENWMRLPADPERPGKAMDVFYLYPTSTSSRDCVGTVDAGMKRAATAAYMKGPGCVEAKVNAYAPWYRQMAIPAILADPTADGLQRSIASHVVKTDVFAALDRYFTRYNPDGRRPFVLAAHSQGSCCLKIAFEEYFTGERKAYLKNLVAAYAVGYVFPKSWCAKYGVRFATGRTDTGVLVSWNAEGPNVTFGTNMLTLAPDGQAINPINWKTDATPAAKAENLGSYLDGVAIPGACAARLVENRPGAVVVTDTDYAFSPRLFGTESYHVDDWSLFRENACRNMFERLAALSANRVTAGRSL